MTTLIISGDYVTNTLGVSLSITLCESIQVVGYIGVGLLFAIESPVRLSGLVCLDVLFASYSGELSDALYHGLLLKSYIVPASSL